MLKEWNGSLVHISEFEPKQPQIRRRRTSADAIALQDIRPIKFQQPTNVSGVEADSGGASVGIANLTLPGDFAFSTQGTSAMKPANPSLQNRRRQLNALLGRVTVTV
jgi:hypothetical protein